MSDAWHAARDLVAVGRARCLEAIARELGVDTAQLPQSVHAAVRTLAHDAFTLGMRYVHEMPTVPPRQPPAGDDRPGEYRVDRGKIADEVTRVERPRRR